MVLLSMNWVSQTLGSFMVRVPCSFFVCLFIIEHYKLKESAWPKTVWRSSLVLGLITFLLFF